MQKYPHQPISQPIEALMPRDESGSQFLVYGDCCSGLAGAPHEATFASVNAIAARLWPSPDFICFLGDEISGLTADYDALRAQWKHWLDCEMAWLDRETIPLHQVASNHTVYDEASEQIFREFLHHLPRNGPRDQEGLSYYVRRNHLLLVFINTSTSALGGDGWVESAWLAEILREHADATFKFVLGHQPMYPVKGYAGPRMCEVEQGSAQRVWKLLVENGVLAYLCSHMLCFDVQVHQGVLQILTSGAGTAHLPPGGYLHLTQCAVDRYGLRYQTVDTAGHVRDSLSWPLQLTPAAQWPVLSTGVTALIGYPTESAEAPLVFLFDFTGVNSIDNDGRAQTFLSAWDSDYRLAPLWIGLCGIERELTVKITPAEGRSPQLWRGPRLAAGDEFSLQLAVHRGMGPGGLLWRLDESSAWTSLAASSQWGAERLRVAGTWSIGHDRAQATRAMFRGSELRVKWHSQSVPLT